MKRLLLIMVLVSVMGGLKAQVQNWDTLYFGDREPTFYYWDTNWWDHYAQNPRYPASDYWSEGRLGMSLCKPEHARYCYTDSTLRVIGVAAAIYIDQHHIQWNDDPLAYLEDEYFRLYEVDSTTDEMILLAEKSWKNATMRYQINAGLFRNISNYYPLHEVYFDNPVLVTDSFYVSVTSNNNYAHRNHLTVPYCYTYIWAVSVALNSPDSEIMDRFPHPNHFRRKLHVVGGQEEDYRYLVTDTNWHTFHKVHNLGNNTTDPNYQIPEFDEFMYIFPIIDTGYHGQPICGRPRDLGASFISSEQVIFTWDGMGGDSWELAVAPDGGTPETANVTPCSGTVFPVQGLDTGRWHVAWVRSVCGTDSVIYSDWSDSVRFYVPGDGQQGTEGIGNTADRYTYIMPNPATERVTVASSFRIGQVELYTLNGQRVLQQRVDGMSTVLDVSGLAAGTYILRVHTNNGVSNKKLVVKG